MPNSYVAELGALIRANISSPAPADVTPPPVPQTATYTYVTVEQLPSREAETLTGRSGLCHAMMQIGCWDKDYEAAWQMREAIKNFVMGFRGATGSQTIYGVNHQNSAELYDGNRSLHHLTVRLWIWWSS